MSAYSYSSDPTRTATLFNKMHVPIDEVLSFFVIKVSIQFWVAWPDIGHIPYKQLCSSHGCRTWFSEMGVGVSSSTVDREDVLDSESEGADPTADGDA